MKTIAILVSLFIFAGKASASQLVCNFEDKKQGTVILTAEILKDNVLRLIKLKDPVQDYSYIDDSEEVYGPVSAKPLPGPKSVIYDFGDVNHDENWQHIYVLRFPANNLTDATLIQNYSDEYGGYSDYELAGSCSTVEEK